MTTPKTITKKEIKKIIRRLTGTFHDLIMCDTLHLKCRKCKKMFTCPYDWMDSIGISDWYEEIRDEKCQN